MLLAGLIVGLHVTQKDKNKGSDKTTLCVHVYAVLYYCLNVDWGTSYEFNYRLKSNSRN
jgi:uncharacterized membrane protein YwaF